MNPDKLLKVNAAALSTLQSKLRLLLAVPKVRPHDAAAWVHYLTGLWLGGLRLAESVALSWDDDASFAVDLSGRHPRLRIRGEAQKSGKDQLLPLTPDFAEFLLATRPDERVGQVFKPAEASTGIPLAPHRVGEIVSKIGRKAAVVVNKADGKYATCHDLRRSFGTRWTKRVMPASLQRLMRHEEIQTTMGHYVDLDVDEMADELWANHPATVGVTPGIGNKAGNIDPNGGLPVQDGVDGKACTQRGRESSGGRSRTYDTRIMIPLL